MASSPFPLAHHVANDYCVTKCCAWTPNLSFVPQFHPRRTSSTPYNPPPRNCRPLWACPTSKILDSLQIGRKNRNFRTSSAQTTARSTSSISCRHYRNELLFIEYLPFFFSFFFIPLSLANAKNLIDPSPPTLRANR